MHHDIEWVTAPPLWDVAQSEPGGRTRFREPALLRFDSDSFMEDLIDLFGKGSPDVADRVAKPETWERPASGWVTANDPTLASTLNLFQPVHGRFYVCTASLICRRVGLPMRTVKAADGERTSMIMRRLVAQPGRTVNLGDPASFTEQAWVGDRKAGTWSAAVATSLTRNEERLPLFPIKTSIEPGRTRLAWGGLLPVASREIYEGARPSGSAARQLQAGSTPDPLAALSDPRKATFAARVIQGFVTLLESPPVPTDAAVLTKAAPDMRESLAYTLLDFADALAADLPLLWDAITRENPAGLATPLHNVYDALAANLPGTGSWREALRRVEAHRPSLVGTGSPSGPAPVANSLSGTQLRSAVTSLVSGGSLQSLVFNALGTPPATASTIVGGAPEVAAAAAAGGEAQGGVYVLRFVYERPVCDPYHDPVISAPTRPFRLGGFFDPDAPARPLVIRLPLDTSPKGLRRFPKGVAMLVSSKLRQQVERVRNVKLEDIDKGEIKDEPGWGIGMICSLSIPIITLVAFIVLMIFLSLLNIVFWWMAFFKICLPIPVRNN